MFFIEMLNLIGNLAGIAGLVLTIFTLIAATGARKAALAAGEAVRHGTAAEEFRSLNKLASEFLSYIENSQIEAAAVRAKDLLAGIVAAKQRWRRFLSTERVIKLEEASTQVSVISRSLMAKGAPASQGEREKLLKFTHLVVRLIAEEAGTITSESELRKQ
jgi:hypothetical protein